MRNYSTQMEAARKGIITPELEVVAKKERMTTEELLPLVASGKVVICANKNHKCIDPEGVGSMLRTKINVKSRCIQRLQGLRCGNAESYGSCKHGRTCHYGSVLPRKHHSIPPQTDKRVSGNDRNGSGL